MEYVDGETLKCRLGSEGRGLALSERWRLLSQIAAGLCFAHGRGVIHRDIKPENILVTKGGAVKIADFGLAQMFREESRLTRSGNVLGTPCYMSPEQIRGEPLSQQSDVYSFGILAYELAAGSPPFTGETLYRVAEQHLTSELPMLPDDSGCCEWYNDFVRRCCAKETKDRFATMEDTASYLRDNGIDVPAYGMNAAGNIVSSKPSGEDSLRTWFIRRQRLWTYVLLYLVCLVTPYCLASHLNNSANEISIRSIFFLERATGLDLWPLRLLTGVDAGYADRQDFGWSAEPGSGDERAAERVRIRFWAAIEAGLDPDYRGAYKRNTYLHAAANSGWDDSSGRRMLSDVLHRGANPNLVNDDGMTPLYLAVMREMPHAVAALLDAGADQNIAGPDGYTPLALALRRDQSRLSSELLLSRLDPNIALPEGQSLLHLAAVHADSAAVHRLLELGGDANAQDSGGRTPLMTAIAENSPGPRRDKVIRMLAARTNLLLTDKQGKTAYDLASSGDEAQELISLLRAE